MQNVSIRMGFAALCRSTPVHMRFKALPHVATNINSPYRLHYDCVNVSCENLMADLNYSYSLGDGLFYSPHLSALQSIDTVKRNERLISSETTCESISKPMLDSPLCDFKIQTTRQYLDIFLFVY